uniref:Uncharacterized protein n=1 Tax=Timema poppense TaxID=170557 RepID=A0A7R9DTK7_TIMPO|nr:unnamed protein product [Timema poppensis]
MTSSARCSVL